MIPSYEKAKSLSTDYKVIPVATSIFSDVHTPVEVMRILRNQSSHCYMLESLEDTEKWGRYTFLGYDPKMEVTCKNNSVFIDNIKQQNVSPLDILRKIISDNKSPKIKGLPPFTGGLVGYFSYDFIQYSESSLHFDTNDEENFRDYDLMLFDKVIAYDNLKQKIYLITNIKTDNLDRNYKLAQQELDNMSNLIRCGKPKAIEPLSLMSDFTPLFSKEKYCNMVEKAKKHIFEGNIFQVVLSNRLEAKASGSLFDTYRILRTSNPSPYMFYFSSDDIEIAGSSPETLVKLTDKKLFTYPLAGTRKRGKTEDEDNALMEDLLNDPKELAEHNMLVDLGRNDLGKVCSFGTVNVEKYMNIEKYSHVMHIGSTVSGTIAEDKDAIDAISSVLPAGTLSGAPKIKACQIINVLENDKRGIYGGAIGYIDFTGNMDTCISIRIAFKKNGKVFVRSGAGIVADSIAENEHTECLNKAAAVINALKEADGGID